MFIADSPSRHQSSFYNLKSIATIGQKAQQLADQRETVGLSEGGRPSKTGLSKDPVSPSAQGVGHGTDQHKHFSWGSYLDHLNKDWFPGRDLTGLDAGTPVKWAEDGHKIAVEVAYDLPESHFLAKPYYDKAEPLVDQQLAVAGVRLSRSVRGA